MSRKIDWRIYAKKADFNRIAGKYNIDPVIARVIRNRDVITDDEIEMYLYGNYSMLHDPHLMKDMDKGTDIIAKKISEGKRIRIISDYDVDGVMSNYVLLKGLKEAGAIVDYEIPDRMLDGYGINERIIRDAVSDGIDTIITCDNGIAAFNAIKLAKEEGLTVVVTDHHEEKEEKVAADAVIDIKQAVCQYPFKEICGAVVAFKFIQCLYEKMNLKLMVYDYKEFIAIATVCDVMDLRDENRVIVKEGLKKLAKTNNKGLRALLQLTGLEGKELTAHHLGFVIGPCINASGRLESAKKGLKLLLEEDDTRVMEMAANLVEINDKRKNMTLDGIKVSDEIIERDNLNRYNVLVVYMPELHESLAGIVAGRIREKYYKPVIVLTASETEGIIKGSGRSIEGYNMFKELEKVADIMTKFGGHELAAGLSLERARLDEFIKVLNDNETMTEEILTEKIMIDVPMPASYVTFKIIEQLDELSPYGKGNPQPLFAEARMKVKSARILGKNRNVLKLILIGDRNNYVEAIYFNPEEFINNIKMWFTDAECDKIFSGKKNDVLLDIIYQPTINEFMGEKSIQLVVRHYRKGTVD